ncbi:NADH_pyrophosphatase [Hexamita inflata]|uniref:NADH pyrophosphatase n=1 Tax=Hexamita inflata TaxID=28002 RepID=A0AA86PIM1_9EUKA|nr:NADH pyrophosphatase [Hexamita inflata]CAI9939188.1 NADH pyrophosphatase [Hexamita inflata]
MKATFSSLTYCHDGFERVFEPLTAEQIQRALSSALSKIVTFQSETFDILFHDCQYILSIAEIVDLFHVDLKEQYASGNVSLIGYLGDACVFLFKTTQTNKEFINFYNAKYADFDRLSQVTGLGYATTRFHWQSKFCSRCQQKLEFQSTSQTYMRCKPCNLEFYPPIQPAIIALVYFRDEILVYHRRENIFTHISGFLEPVETAIQATYRELNEELGLQKHQIQSVEPMSETQPWPSRYCSLMMPFKVELKEKLEFKPTKEVSESKWISKQLFLEAANRSDKGEKVEWIVPSIKTVARFMMEKFFE